VDGGRERKNVFKRTAQERKGVVVEKWERKTRWKEGNILGEKK
jgi:hypothetical protein